MWSRDGADFTPSPVDVHRPQKHSSRRPSLPVGRPWRPRPDPGDRACGFVAGPPRGLGAGSAAGSADVRTWEASPSCCSVAFFWRFGAPRESARTFWGALSLSVSCAPGPPPVAARPPAAARGIYQTLGVGAGPAGLTAPAWGRALRSDAPAALSTWFPTGSQLTPCSPPRSRSRDPWSEAGAAAPGLGRRWLLGITASRPRLSSTHRSPPHGHTHPCPRTPRGPPAPGRPVGRMRSTLRHGPGSSRAVLSGGLEPAASALSAEPALPLVAGGWHVTRPRPHSAPERVPFMLKASRCGRPDATRDGNSD